MHNSKIVARATKISPLPIRLKIKFLSSFYRYRSRLNIASISLFEIFKKEELFKSHCFKFYPSKRFIIEVYFLLREIVGQFEDCCTRNENFSVAYMIKDQISFEFLSISTKIKYRLDFPLRDFQKREGLFKSHCFKFYPSKFYNRLEVLYNRGIIARFEDCCPRNENFSVVYTV